MTATYTEGEPFPGRIGRSLAESVPAFAESPRPPAGSPNVLLVVLDDVGYGQLGCFGGDIDTPAIDGLAAEGLRYRQFHTTAMCSPTRAAMLSGRNPHTCGIGGITELASGYPGYAGRLDPSCALVSEVLRQAGWATWAVGKWHLAPADEQHAAASRRRWPLGQGFERFYGFIGPETSQWAPELVIDNSPMVQRELDGEEHLSELLADAVIRSVDDHRVADPEKPFFCYLAMGAGHAPHHVAPSWIERYAGRFDDGWDAARARIHARQLESGIVPAGTPLSERPVWVPEWASLSDSDRRVAARMMEVYAAFVSHADAQIGRVLDHLRATDELDRTLVMVLSDNGASAEGGPTGTFNGAYLYNGMAHDAEATLARLDEMGGPDSFPNYPWGWAYAGNTPFRRWKRETHEGGIGDPLVVRPPASAGAPAGEVRSQYVHAVDLGVTILDACGLAMPAAVNGIEQKPVAGRSLLASFTDPDAPGRDLQYYEQFGCRALYRDGWKAVTFHPMFPYTPDDNPFLPFEDDVWELYHVAVDPAETHDLAEAEPELLAELQELWWSEAERHGALPLHGFRGPIGARTPPRQRAELRPFALAIPESSAPDTKRDDHRLTVALTVHEAGDGSADGAAPGPASGVLIAQGGRFGGFSLYLHEGALRYAYNFFGTEITTVAADSALPAGRHLVEVEARPASAVGPMDVRILVDGAEVAVGRVPRLIPLRFSLSGEGLCCGYDDGTAVTPDYTAPNRCTATIHAASVDVAGADALPLDDQVRKALMSQ